MTYITDIEDTVACIEAMHCQEETGYASGDYLHQNETESGSLQTPLHVVNDKAIRSLFDVDADSRSKMAAWCYQVVDFCKFNRESVEIAMSYLDRYLTTTDGITALFDRSLFQLACMTSLYTAVKIHEPEAMDPQLVARLSRGVYTADEIEAMEQKILTALNWRVNPPTSLSFCREFVNLIPAEVLDQPTRRAAYDLAKIQMELAVREYAFISVNPSKIAFCSLMNALESLIEDEQILGYVGYIVAESIGADCNDKEVVYVQGRLHDYVLAKHKESIENADCTSPTSTPKAPSRQVARTISPRSVAALL